MPTSDETLAKTAIGWKVIKNAEVASLTQVKYEVREGSVGRVAGLGTFRR
jgi:hypothetical protein